MTRPGRRRPGEVVALQETWRERLWSVRPAIVVEDGPAERMFFVPSGAPWKAPAGPGGGILRIPTDEWSLAERITPRPVLSFAWPDRAYAVLAFWEDRGGTPELAGWYVNLQTPLSPTAAGYRYVDHLLDVLIAADRSTWRWKDEDELDEAVARGIFSVGQADGFRREGLRAVGHVTGGEPPFDRDWSVWRPDPAWPRPGLPAGWDALDH